MAGYTITRLVAPAIGILIAAGAFLATGITPVEATQPNPSGVDAAITAFAKLDAAVNNVQKLLPGLNADADASARAADAAMKAAKSCSASFPGLYADWEAKDQKFNDDRKGVDSAVSAARTASIDAGGAAKDISNPSARQPFVADLTAALNALTAVRQTIQADAKTNLEADETAFAGKAAFYWCNQGSGGRNGRNKWGPFNIPD
jgi:hypothetical protein